MSRCASLSLLFFVIVLFFVVILLFIPYQAARTFGSPSPHLGLWQRFEYSAWLLWYDGILTRPRDINGSEQPFHIETGEAVVSIAQHLQQDGLIRDAGAFRTYLIYTGLDVTIQAGDYLLSPSMSTIDLARALQDATPAEVTFTILPGWRMDEIAASLPTSGLNVAPEAFLAAARTVPGGFDFLYDAATVEGFLFPAAYILPRDISAERLVAEPVRNFALHLSFDLRDGFSRQGLTVYQAVTLASMIQREAVVPDEQPLIASVFLNRLAADIKLDSDPTVQYALGYNAVQGTWWTNPLSVEDFGIDSLYNTYQYAGLPPGPIANPSLNALQAVAYPAQTPYYYFRARCDGSGRHAFAETFEQHVQNACP